MLNEEKEGLRVELTRSNLSEDQVEAIMTRLGNDLATVERKIGEESAKQAAVSCEKLYLSVVNLTHIPCVWSN